LAATQEAAIRYLRETGPDVIVANLCLPDGGAFAVADFASYRHPRARVVLVTSTRFFSDGSVFNHVPNACAFLKEQVPPDDLASIVAHYAG
jgi:DNA-binding NarL/FixJ family response regulator